MLYARFLLLEDKGGSRPRLKSTPLRKPTVQQVEDGLSYVPELRKYAGSQVPQARNYRASPFVGAAVAALSLRAL